MAILRLYAAANSCKKLERYHASIAIKLKKPHSKKILKQELFQNKYPIFNLYALTNSCKKIRKIQCINLIRFNAPFCPKTLMQDFSKENFTLLSYCNFIRKIIKAPSIGFS